MRIITIYGEIERNKIFSNDLVYNLRSDSEVKRKKKGWFSIIKYDNQWRLLRVLFLDYTDVYVYWNHNLISLRVRYFDV